MKLGVTLPSYATDGYRFPHGRIEQYARRAEEHGFAGVWITEHLIRPPAYKFSRLDPLTTLSTVAGATDTIPVGTGVLLLPLRNPVLVAKRAATLQHLSGERLTLGVGLGWAEKEFDAVGVPYEERGRRFTEALDLLTRLLREDEVTFDGEFYSVEDVRIEPELSRPPRVLVGGGGVERDGERFVPGVVKERITRFGDGWIGATRSPDVLGDDWNEIADHLEEQGRDPEKMDKLALTWTHAVPNADTRVAEREQRRVYGDIVSEHRGLDFAMQHNLSGSVDDIRSQLQQYEDLGFNQVILAASTTDPASALQQLSHWERYLLSAFER